MKYLKNYSYILIILSYSSNITANTRPDSFADLAEKLMPSVVNISTTQTVRTTTNQFPVSNFLQVHHLKICLKNFKDQQKESFFFRIRFYHKKRWRGGN